MTDAANEGFRAFGRGGITTVITLNSGALVATLTQLAVLLDIGDSQSIALSFTLWISGVVFGALCWAAAAVAASAFSLGRTKMEQRFTSLGFLLFFLSLGCFSWGAQNLAAAFID